MSVDFPTGFEVVLQRWRILVYVLIPMEETVLSICPTDPFSICEPQNPSIEVPKLLKVSRLTDFKALKSDLNFYFSEMTQHGPNRTYQKGSWLKYSSSTFFAPSFRCELLKVCNIDWYNTLPCIAVILPNDLLLCTVFSSTRMPSLSKLLGD